jgi:hypothetical protein
MAVFLVGIDVDGQRGFLPPDDNRRVSDQLDVLKLVAARLEAASIPYMVTGSIAANHYATPRFTRDIDVVVELAPGDTEHVSELIENEFYGDREALRRATRRRGVNLIHRDLLVKVDFIVRKG